MADGGLFALETGMVVDPVEDPEDTLGALVRELFHKVQCARMAPLVERPRAWLRDPSRLHLRSVRQNQDVTPRLLAVPGERAKREERRGSRLVCGRQ